MNAAAKEAVRWLQAAPLQAYAGFALGARQPALRVRLTAAPGPAPHLDGIWAQSAEWAEALGEAAPPDSWAEQPDGLEKAGLWLLHWSTALQRSAGLPVFEAGRMTRSRQADGQPSELTLWLPCAPGRLEAARTAFAAVMELFEDCLCALFDDSSSNPSLHALLPEPGPRLKAAREQLSSSTAQGANTPRLLRAAFELGIPVWPLGRDVYRYGQGSRARWLDSTFTDSTSNIASRMARDKAWTAARLAEAGIPVPRHQGVADADHAVRVARELGFPVVVKPADLDGGRGVSAGLRDEQAVHAAFERAQRLSQRILLEQHVHGRDYRLTVHAGELLWAVERIPGGVTGDGRRNVAELLAELNADPCRGEGAHAPLKRLPLDEEAHSLLAEASLDEHSVPAAGQFVALRRIANVATGGMPVAVNAAVHPDNAQLALRAARALGLDLAGVDLLLPDIGRSWRESGGAVCEVNGQPQLGATTGPHLYGELLKRLLRKGGRIPIALILGAAPGSLLAQGLARELGAAGLRVGWSDEHGVAIDGQWLTAGPLGSFAAGRMLLGDRGVDAVVLSVSDQEVALHGLPFERCDLLLFAGHHLAGGPALDSAQAATAWKETLMSALPACSGVVLQLEGTGLDASGWSGLTRARIDSTPRSREHAITLMARRMLQGSGSAAAKARSIPPAPRPLASLTS